MKKQTFCWIFLICLLALPAKAQMILPKNAIGKIKVLKASVTITRQGKKVRIGRLGTLVMKNDVIATGEKGKARILLAAGDEVFLGPRSVLTLTKQLSASPKKFRFKYVATIFGKIRSRVRASFPHRFVVKTANAVIGVKGTDFVVEYVNQVTTVGTLSGLVEMSSSVTKERTDIPAGKMTSIPADGELLPLSSFAGTLLEGVEISGTIIKEEEISGEKIEL
ncbi:MAG: hypothetical protein COB67_09925 [SAR324 cluster bacterium]|uniref:FecR protein domain-containing protein n=1 Tax=SAR324 cluster bacterium TaxID=2024889 RepID=A0A2A4SZX3_9DELT|nr:MAG: hypothetical protein COB67_09925 [SAR324 cluster bacterium]